MCGVVWIVAALIASSNSEAPNTKVPPPRAAAVVVRSVGPVKVARDGKDGVALRSCSRIFLGDLISVGKSGSAIVVVLVSGARYKINEGSSVKAQAGSFAGVSGSPPTVLKPLDKRLLRGVAASRSFEPRSAGVLVRGGDSGKPFTSLSPIVGTRPGAVTVRWSDGPYCDALIVRVIADDEELFSRRLVATEKQCEIDTLTLEEGRAYRWSIGALRGDIVVESASADVRVLTQDEVRALTDLEASTKAVMRIEPEDDAPLLCLASTYETLGLLDDAVRSYTDLLGRRKKDEGITEALKQIEAMRKPHADESKGETK